MLRGLFRCQNQLGACFADGVDIKPTVTDLESGDSEAAETPAVAGSRSVRHLSRLRMVQWFSESRRMRVWLASLTLTA
jgi:hypothetical protein